MSNDVIPIVDDSRFIAQAYSRAVGLGAQSCRPLVSKDHERLPAGIVVKLSPRERQIVDLLLKGWQGKKIADELRISVKTVKTHFSRMYMRNGIAGGVKQVKLPVMTYRERAR